MRGYLSVVGASSGTVPVESRVGIYRDPGETHEVLAATDDRVHQLGVSDPTVSRKKDGRAPVVVVPRDDALEVRNEGNTNGVTVRADGETELDEGQVERVRTRTSVEIGYQTELVLTVEREARVEVRGGDYVAGDKVENRTEIDDSVVNRSDVGGSGVPADEDAPAKREESTVVEDSVINRSNVGGGSSDEDTRANDDGGDTKEFCEEHGRAYTDICPECASADAENPPETKFCIYCGTEILERANVCPSCGEEL